MRLLPIGLCLLSALGTVTACGTQRPPSPEQVAGGLSLKLSASDVTIQPGISLNLTVKVKTTTALSSPVQLSFGYPDGMPLPNGLTYSFDPSQLTVQAGQEVQTTLRLAADPSIKVTDYAFVVTVRCDGKEASIPMILRVAGIGPQWERQIGTAQTDTISAMATDSQGNLYVAMNSTGTVDGKTNQGDYDGYLLAYSPSGSLRWTAQLASNKTDYISGLTVDGTDTLWVSGYTFGVLPGQMPQGRTDGFVARFSQAGQRLWVKQLGTSEIDKLMGVAVSSQGIATVVGSTEGSYGGGANIGFSDIWAVRIDGGGNELSSVQIGSDQIDYANAVAVDDKLQLTYVVGATAGVLPTGISQGLQDGFVMTIDASGKLGWVRHVGSAGNDELLSATVDDSSGLWAAGYTKGTLPGQISMGGQDGMLVKFVSDGTRKVTKQIGTSYLDVIQSISWVGGSLFSIGSTRGAFLGQDALGGFDVFVGKHSTDGSLAWVSQDGTDQADNAAAICGRDNMVYIGANTFGVFPNLQGQGDSDGYIQALRSY